MTKIKEIIKANSLNVSSGMSGHFELTPGQLDTAASAIEKVHDEEIKKCEDRIECYKGIIDQYKWLLTIAKEEIERLKGY